MLSLLWIEILRVTRNVRVLLFTVALPAALYLLYTVMYGAQMSIGSTDWAAYLMVSMAVFGGAGAALSTLGTRLAVERSGGWTRLLRTTPLTAAQYVGAKLVVSVLAAIPAIALLMLLAALADHVGLSVREWLSILGFSVLGVVPFSALGLLLGYLFDAESAQAGQTIVWLAISLLGGLWVPVQAMPATLRQMAPYFPTYRAADLVRSVLGAGLRPVGQDLLVLLAYTIVLGVLAAWRYRGVTAQANV